MKKKVTFITVLVAMIVVTFMLVRTKKNVEEITFTTPLEIIVSETEITFNTPLEIIVPSVKIATCAKSESKS